MFPFPTSRGLFPTELKRGVFVRISGLKQREDMNGLEGVVLNPCPAQHGRFVINIHHKVKNEESNVSVKRDNLNIIGNSMMVLRHGPKDAAPEDIPLEVSYLAGDNETEEKQDIKTRFGWSMPVGIKQQTDGAGYTDLYVYYDSQSCEPVNHIASAKFKKCKDQGKSSVCQWTGKNIRGPVIITRTEPPTYCDSYSFGGISGSSMSKNQSPHEPVLFLDEMRKYFSQK